MEKLDVVSLTKHEAAIFLPLEHFPKIHMSPPPTHPTTHTLDGLDGDLKDTKLEHHFANLPCPARVPWQ